MGLFLLDPRFRLAPVTESSTALLLPCNATALLLAYSLSTDGLMTITRSHGESTQMIPNSQILAKSAATGTLGVLFAPPRVRTSPGVPSPRRCRQL
jgi:hypothetical protein